MREVYLDNAATTPLDPRVRAAMEPFLGECFANPSSAHRAGVRAAEALDEARRRIARVVGARAERVVFTGGGSEANALGVLGQARARRARGGHVLVGPTEHPCVRESAARLAREGFEVETLPLDAGGALDLEAAARRLRPDTVLVAQMLVNNEFGSVFAVAELARLVRSRAPHAAVHVDAVQALGKLELSLPDLEADSLALSAHKVHGPKGVGALCLGDTEPRVEPLVVGGGQEAGLRAGTQNVAGAVGFGVAAEIAERERPAAVTRMRGLRERLAAGLAELGARVLAPGAQVREPVCSILAALFPGPPAEVRLHHLDARGVAASAGSACQAGKREISPALLAIGLSADEARRVLRFSLSRETTSEDVEQALAALAEVERELGAHR